MLGRKRAQGSQSKTGGGPFVGQGWVVLNPPGHACHQSFGSSVDLDNAGAATGGSAVGKAPLRAFERFDCVVVEGEEGHRQVLGHIVTLCDGENGVPVAVAATPQIGGEQEASLALPHARQVACLVRGVRDKKDRRPDVTGCRLFITSRDGQPPHRGPAHQKTLERRKQGPLAP